MYPIIVGTVVICLIIGFYFWRFQSEESHFNKNNDEKTFKASLRYHYPYETVEKLWSLYTRCHEKKEPLPAWFLYIVGLTDVYGIWSNPKNSDKPMVIKGEEGFHIIAPYQMTQKNEDSLISLTKEATLLILTIRGEYIPQPIGNMIGLVNNGQVSSEDSPADNYFAYVFPTFSHFTTPLLGSNLGIHPVLRFILLTHDTDLNTGNDIIVNEDTVIRKLAEDNIPSSSYRAFIKKALGLDFKTYQRVGGLDKVMLFKKPQHKGYSQYMYYVTVPFSLEKVGTNQKLLNETKDVLNQRNIKSLQQWCQLHPDTFMDRKYIIRTENGVVWNAELHSFGGPEAAITMYLPAEGETLAPHQFLLLTPAEVINLRQEVQTLLEDSLKITALLNSDLKR